MREISGKEKEPLLMMIYGQPSIGKTTFASHAPSPVFIGDELNKEFDFPKIVVDCFDDIEKAIQMVMKEPKYKGTKTIVLDSISSLEDMLRKEIIESDPRGKEFASINQVHGGYGRGVDRMVFKTQNLINKLKEVNEKGMNIIITCHSIKDTEEDATLLRTNVFYRPSLERKTLRVWEKWLPVILFARDKIILDSESDKTKTLADRRVIYTQYRASHYAKNRYGLDFEIDFKPDVVKSIIKFKEQFYDGAEVKAKPQSKIDVKELKDIWARIPENKKPKINWNMINAKNFKKSRDKLMELAE